MDRECAGEVELKDTDSKYKLLFECALDILMLIDINGDVVDVNDAAVKEYGYSRKALLSMKVGDLRAPSERDIAGKQLRDAFTKGMTFETIHRRKDGSQFPVEVSSRGVIINGEKMLIAIVRDITRRKEAERNLARLAAIVESSDDAILGMTPEGVITEWNHGAEVLYGYTANEMIGRSVSVLIPGDRAGELAHIIDTVKGGGHLEHFDTVRILKNGTPVQISLTASPIRSSRGALLGISWTARDITGRKKIEEALRESHALFDAITTNTPDHIYVKDREGRFIFVNPAVLDFFGKSREAMIGKSNREVIDDAATLRTVVENDRRVMESGRTQVFEEVLHVPNAMRVFLSTKTPLRNDKGEVAGLVGISRDITERKRAVEALRESEANLAKAQRIAHVGSYSLDTRADRAQCSDEFYRILGIAPRGFFSLRSFLDYVHPEDRDVFEREYRRSIDLGTTYNGEFRIVRPNWEVRTIRGDGEPILDQTGRTVEMFGIIQDITERKRAEEDLRTAKAQAELYLDLMGHDINNMNQIAMGYIETAVGSFKLNEEEREFLERPLDTLRNSAKLIGNVRKLQKMEAGGLKYRKIDLCDVLSKVVADYSRTPGREVTINFTPIPGCYVIANDLIADVFSNLIGNSIKHSDPGRPLEINIGLEPVTEKGKKYYKVIVEDNGPGIPDELKSRLFMRFQRGQTKAMGKGLGLYLVRTLVNDFHGKIWVADRAPGDHTKGARFMVLLPAVET